MHPLCGATPEQKGCSADGSGVLLLVLWLLWGLYPLWVLELLSCRVWWLVLDCVLCRWSAVWRCTRCGAVHPL